MSIVSSLVSPAVCFSIAALLCLAAAGSLLRPTRASRDRSATPPRSVSKKPTEKGSRRLLASLLTNAIPRSKLSPLAPPSPPSASPATELPVTNRSKEEIDSYGDFPDYAALSGVPLPRPYPEFDIAKALPRPYRPFRWVYHQTMCGCRLPVPCCVSTLSA